MQNGHFRLCLVSENKRMGIVLKPEPIRTNLIRVLIAKRMGIVLKPEPIRTNLIRVLIAGSIDGDYHEGL